jgi:thiol-disulfide isomerase/thioredoxin
MTALSSLVLAALLSAPPALAHAASPLSGQTVLVQFSSQRCPYCQAMQPIVTKLSQEGCPLHVIDVDQQRDVAQQYGVSGVPTYVALSAGRETGRIVGPASYERLTALWRGPGAGRSSAPPDSDGPRTESPRLVATDFRGPGPAGGQVEKVQGAAAATVRIKVEDATGYGFGTGTIIDTHESEALVVTCGHLFRESQGKGKIAADLFAGGASQTVGGQLIAYDLDRDIALLSIRLPFAVRPAQVAPPGAVVRPGEQAFTIGCDKGADPSVQQTQITAVNKYMGKPNYTAAGQPIDGRSGGGLFSADGLLIGVCNAADPQDNEGLYAGLASIHWQLDQIGQAEIYQRAARATVAAAAPAVAPAGAEAPLAQATPLPQLPVQMPAAPAATPLAPAELAPVAAADDSEIVFIVRSKRDPQQRSEVYVVDQPPPDLIARITHAARTTGERQAALARSRATESLATGPFPAAPVVRGQSN